jgi:hypothetical protein
MEQLTLQSAMNFEVVTGAEADEFLGALSAASGVTAGLGPRRRSVTIRKFPYLQWRSLSGDQFEVDTNVVAWRGYLLEVGYRLEQKPYQEDGQGKVLCYSHRCTIGNQVVEKDYPLPLPFYGPARFERTEENEVRQTSEVRVIDPQLARLMPVGSNPERGRSCAECVAQGNHVYVEERNGRVEQVVCGGTGYILFCVIDLGLLRPYRENRGIRHRVEFIPIEGYEYLEDRPFSGPVVIRAWIGRQLALRNIATQPEQYGMPDRLLNLGAFLKSLLRVRGAIRPVKRAGSEQYQLQYTVPVEMYVVPPVDTSKVGGVPLFRAIEELRPFPQVEGSDVDNWLDLAWRLYDAEEQVEDEALSFYGQENGHLLTE